MKRIKIILLAILIIICTTGCDGVYTLKINSDFSMSDSLEVEENGYESEDIRNENIRMYKQIYQDAFDYHEQLYNFYETNRYGVRVSNSYSSIDDYNNSSVCKSFKCKMKNEEYEEYNILTITLNYDSFIFRDCGEGDMTGPQYVYLDIDIPFEILDTNAYKKLTNNKYRWLINAEDLSEVTIKYTTEAIKEKQREKTRRDYIIVGSVVLVYVVIIMIIIINKKRLRK